MSQWLPAAHLALTLLILVWDVALAGRIAHVRRAPKSFAVTSALCGFFILPALAIHLATSSVVTGRALVMVGILWPATLFLFVLQSVLAIGRRVVNPIVGLPILLYNVVLAVTATLSLVSASGAALLELPLALLVAQNDVLAFVTSGATLTSPLFLSVPILSPAFPPLRGLTATLRGVLAAFALVWVATVTIAVLKGQVVLREYRQFDEARLTERPAGDFRIGVKILPDIARPPSALAIRSDLALAAEMDAAAVSVTVVPDAAADAATLDSVARVLGPLRRSDSVRVIVAIGYRGKLFPRSSSPDDFDREERLRAVEQVVRRLRPDILLPAEDPYGAGARAFGLMPVETWQSYLTEAAALAKRLRPRTRVGVSISSFGSRDSTLYTWATAPGSPMDVVGFSLFPGTRGAQDLTASMRAADRWMRQQPSRKEHWVFNAGGFPLRHGERSQERTIWGTIAWATGHANIKGLVVASASDYVGATGLQAPDGRRRPAAATVVRAVRALDESVGARRDAVTSQQPAAPIAIPDEP